MLEMRSYAYSTTKTMVRKLLEPGQLRAFVFLDTTGMEFLVGTTMWRELAHESAECPCG